MMYNRTDLYISPSGPKKAVLFKVQLNVELCTLSIHLHLCIEKKEYTKNYLYTVIKLLYS